jgi:hypothetical protein
MTGNYTFAHEMGHNMGANHDTYVELSNLPYPYAHGYVYTPDRWRTIMAYNDQCVALGFNCNRLNYWSNPNINYGGVPMGDAATADNHRALNNTAPTVTQFRPRKFNALGVFRSGKWYFDRSANGTWDSALDGVYSFGMSGDLPVVGDWTGDGIEKIGVFRNGQWYLDWNGNRRWDDCTIDRCYAFGKPGDQPVAGRWSGSADKIGVFRNGSWYLDVNGNGAWDGCNIDGCHHFGVSGDKPVVLDYVNLGDRIAVLRNGSWYLDLNDDKSWSGCSADGCYFFGQTGDNPVAGSWRVFIGEYLGVFRQGNWYLDASADGKWSGCGITADKDRCYHFGQPGDIPVIGNW